MRKGKNEYERIRLRFKIILIIVFCVTLINWLIFPFFIDLEVFEVITFGVSWGVFIWFLTDYKMLRLNKFYFLSLLVAIVILAGGFAANYYYDIGLICFALPLLLLIIQKPLRVLFLIYFKREPIVDRYDGKWNDIIYALILLFGTVFLSTIIL